MAKLAQLKSLLDQGVLTQAEFDVQKTEDPAEHVSGRDATDPKEERWHLVLYSS